MAMAVTASSRWSRHRSSGRGGHGCPESGGKGVNRARQRADRRSSGYLPVLNVLVELLDELGVLLHLLAWLPRRRGEKEWLEPIYELLTGLRSNTPARHPGLERRNEGTGC